VRIALHGGLALASLMIVCACGSAVPEPLTPSTAGTEVLRLRWIKRLAPELPNFMVPEMVEEHDRFNPVEMGSAGFDTDKRRVFVGAAVGGLYCLDIRDGETVWRFGVDDPVGSTPVYDSSRAWVFFGADDGVLYSLHARSGRKIWSVETGSEIRRPVVLRDDTLYVSNADNTILAFDAENGEIIWRYRRAPLEGFSASGYADITVEGPMIISGFADGMLVALDAVTGAMIWETDLAAEVVAATEEGALNLVDADATPVVIGNVVVAASVAGGMYGVDLESGNILWTRPDIHRVTGLAAANGFAYAARAGIGLTAVDPMTGRVDWSSRFGLGVLLDPLVYDDVLVVSDTVAGLYVISTADGRVMQRFDQREGHFARPSTHAGYLLIMGNRGTLYAMSIN
jgi:outer membrane protein assembly factor BamB